MYSVLCPALPIHEAVSSRGWRDARVELANWPVLVPILFHAKRPPMWSATHATRNRRCTAQHSFQCPPRGTTPRCHHPTPPQNHAHMPRLRRLEIPGTLQRCDACRRCFTALHLSATSRMLPGKHGQRATLAHTVVTKIPPPVAPATARRPRARLTLAVPQVFEIMFPHLSLRIL